MGEVTMTDCLLRDEDSCVRVEMSMLSPACESFIWSASMDVASLQDNNIKSCDSLSSGDIA